MIDLMTFDGLAIAEVYKLLFNLLGRNFGLTL